MDEARSQDLHGVPNTVPSAEASEACSFVKKKMLFLRRATGYAFYCVVAFVVNSRYGDASEARISHEKMPRMPQAATSHMVVL